MRKLLCSTIAALAVSAAVAGGAQAQPYHPGPPPLRYEVRPPIPHPGWGWRPGYWNWYGGRYVWVGGVYVAPGGPGFYAGGHWAPGHFNRWGRWVPARWVP